MTIHKKSLVTDASPKKKAVGANKAASVSSKRAAPTGGSKKGSKMIALGARFNG
jgi:hypothetical protein